MKHTCGLPSDTLILWKPSDKMNKAMSEVSLYATITGNAPPKEMIDRLVKDVTT